MEDNQRLNAIVPTLGNANDVAEQDQRNLGMLLLGIWLILTGLLLLLNVRISSTVNMVLVILAGQIHSAPVR